MAGSLGERNRGEARFKHVCRETALVGGFDDAGLGDLDGVRHALKMAWLPSEFLSDATFFAPSDCSALQAEPIEADKKSTTIGATRGSTADEIVGHFVSMNE